MQHSSAPLVLVAVILAGAIGAGLAFDLTAPGVGGPTAHDTEADLADLQTFDSPSEFRAYIDRDRHVSGAGASPDRGGEARVRTTAAGGDGGAPQRDAPSAETVGQAADARIGRTNVQVAGLDEPDRVKTDGRLFYYAPGEPRLVRPDVERRDEAEPPRKHTPPTTIIDASEPADPTVLAEIDATGKLLRTGDRLLVLNDSAVTAYDVSTPAEPATVWSRSVDERLVTAREHDGTVYLVARSPVTDSPCPIEPMDGASIPCTEVYRPGAQVSADGTYTAIAVEAESGAIHDTVSFVGTGHNSVVYMSHEALYVSYTKQTAHASLATDFLLEEFDHTPDSVAARIREIRSYDLSVQSERREISSTVQSWLDSLDEDERERVRSALREQFDAYVQSRQRDIVRTGIVRVDTEGTDLAVTQTATVPGRPLNQFALSEQDGTLRLATTVPSAGDAESVADLTVLDADSLETLGRETGMGEGQRVYAVRYVDETAYVITFRRVDPLHVVDLSDPTDPTEVGTLKLPGFSTYLHPIDDEHVLGVGEVDGKVRAVLFDVSEPTQPAVADDIRMDASWSAVSRTHHAFTIDRRHDVVFIPAEDTGVVFDYTNGTLEREHTVETDRRVERARYVGDSLYVFAGTNLAVVDETTWTRTTTLDLTA